MTSTCDSYYAIGRSHMVCQDVADAWIDGDGLKHAMVSDGCSSSPMSEFGAALLVRAARYRGGGATIFKAREMAEACGVPLSCLDATIMTVREWSADQTVYCCRVDVWGDGVVLAKFRGRDEWAVCHIEFKKGAPAYQSYMLDGDRFTTYLKETEDGLRSLVWHLRIAGEWRNEAIDEGQGVSPFIHHFMKRDFELVMVCSDGVGSFQRKVDGAFEPVPLLAVLDHVIDFKNYQGEFVKRRMRRFLMHEAPALGWHHDDDVSVAAIYMGE